MKGQYLGILQTTEVVFSIILAIIMFSEIPSFIVLVGGILLMMGYFIIGIKETK